MRICPTCATTYPTKVGFCPKDGSHLGELHEWVPGATVRGKYRVLSIVGQGGMGAVYKALHMGFDELRALKVLHRDLAADARFVKRFKQEAFTTRKLQHPNIVRVEDVDETEEGQPFIVMEFIEGSSLRALIEKHGAMRVAAACSVVKQIASALVVAHGLGVVHRDLKPDNIVLVTPAEGPGATLEPTVKVLDFGIAKLREVRAEDNPTDSSLTQPGFFLGTPEYMSPEQAQGKRGDDLDGRSDIYSLGVLMYRMLTGTLPYQATTTIEMLLAHIQQIPRPIPIVRPDLQIPGPIADIVMQCLEKNREARPQTAQALIEALERAETILMKAAATQESSPPVPDRDQEAVRLREQQAALAREREAALAREREAQEREAALVREREAALAQEREAREREAALVQEQEAREREAALAREREVQEREAALVREREAALARERERREQEAREQRAPLAAASGVAGPGATAMIPRTATNPTGVPSATRQEQTLPLENRVGATAPAAAPAKPVRHSSRGIGWAIAIAAIALLALGLLISNRHPAVSDSGVTLKMARPESSTSPVTPSPTPAQDQKTSAYASDAPKNSGKDKKPTVSPSPPTASDPARALELDKTIRDAIEKGDSHRARGEYDEAIRVYEAALKLVPTNTVLHDRIEKSKRAKATEAAMPH